MVHPSQLSALIETTAHDFFERVCPRLLALRRPECAAIGSRFAFEIAGPAGGAWTIDLAKASVTAGAEPDTHVRLAMSDVDFGALLHGTLDVRAAMQESGRMRCDGDLHALGLLALLLDPKGGAYAA